MAQPQQDQRKASAPLSSSAGDISSTSPLKNAASSTFETIQNTWAKVPTPSRRTKVIIASGIALGAVGIAAYMMARRKPRLGVLGGLAAPALVAWNAYQNALKTSKEEIRSRLH